MSVEDVISEDDVVRVHGYANFGDLTPREIVNSGVLKYSMGHTGGSTQIAILREHKLITKPKGYHANLTEKGKWYLREMLTGKFNAILEMCNPQELPSKPIPKTAPHYTY